MSLSMYGVRNKLLSMILMCCQCRNQPRYYYLPSAFITYLL